MHSTKRKQQQTLQSIEGVFIDIFESMHGKNKQKPICVRNITFILTSTHVQDIHSTVAGYGL